MSHARLIVVSAPSGTGKGTLIKRLQEAVPNVWLSVSATTRKPRSGEIDGENYFFMTREEFETLANEGGFLEFAEYSGNMYGTPVASVKEHLDAGQSVILEIDLKGALQIKEKMPEAVLIFIEPPSMEELERRLRERGTETEESISKRMKAAEVEMSSKMYYDMRLVNDDLDTAVQEFIQMVESLTE